MLVKFKQAVHIKKKDYSRGVHEVPVDVLADAYFHRLIQAGLVEDADKIVAPISAEERQKQLAEKISALTKKPEASSEPKAVEPVAPLSEDEELAKMEAEEVEAKVKAEMEESKAEPAKKKHKR